MFPFFSFFFFNKKKRKKKEEESECEQLLGTLKIHFELILFSSEVWKIVNIMVIFVLKFLSLIITDYENRNLGI